MIVGSTADGADARIHPGMYLHPDGKQWSNEPFTWEQIVHDREIRRENRIHDEIYDYCEKRRITWRDAYNQIASKSSGLSARCKKYLINIIENPVL